MNDKKRIPISVLVSENGSLPFYASAQAAGADIRACVSQDFIVPPGQSVLIPTGLRFEIPEGYEIQVRPRSGLAAKHGLTVLNSPGTIDSDYRGEIQIILINHSQLAFTVTPGMRIAQIVVAPVFQADFQQTDLLTTTVRGEGGFGHSGLN